MATNIVESMIPIKDTLTLKRKGTQRQKKPEMGVKKQLLMRARLLLPDMVMMVKSLKRALHCKSHIILLDKSRPKRPLLIIPVRTTPPDNKDTILLEIKDTVKPKSQLLLDKEVEEMLLLTIQV